MCGVMGAMFFSVIEIHSQNQTIKRDNREIGELKVKTGYLEEELIKTKEEMDKCRLAKTVIGFCATSSELFLNDEDSVE
jgi:hypothetical protein